MESNIRELLLENRAIFPHYDTLNTMSSDPLGKNRKRTKGENRNFKCSQCEKTYLSYPALYTHTKIKHAGKEEITKSRGRPKKPLSKSNDGYFETEGRRGGPTAVIYKFKEAFDLLYLGNNKGYANHNLYVELYKLHLKNIKELDYSIEHLTPIDFEVLPSSFSQDNANSKNQIFQSHLLSEDMLQQKEIGNSMLQITEESQKSCVEAFAEYLELVASRVTKDCYKEILKFIFLFYECFIQYVEKSNKREGEVSLVKSAEYIPVSSNEFVTVYLDNIKTSFGNMNPIDLTQHFCTWLFEKGYTCYKIARIQNNN